jgi:hypothetical protein
MRLKLEVSSLAKNFKEMQFLLVFILCIITMCTNYIVVSLAFQFIAVFIGDHGRRKAKETGRNIVNQVTVKVYLFNFCIDHTLNL